MSCFFGYCRCWQPSDFWFGVLGCRGDSLVPPHSLTDTKLLYIASEYRHPTGGCLVLGRDVSARDRARSMVLFVPDPRHLQPQDRRLRGTRHRQRRSRRASGPAHCARRGRPCHAGAAGAARRQRRDIEGYHGLAMLYWLGIEPSYSRPRISDDNPYAEALFRTAKYRPEFPIKVCLPQCYDFIR